MMLRGLWIALSSATLLHLGALLAANQEDTAPPPRPQPRIPLYATIEQAIEARDLYGALEHLPAVAGQDEKLQSLMLQSAALGCAETMYTMVRAGGDIYTPAFGSTVLHEAAAAGHIYTIHAGALAGANFSALNDADLRPIHTAALHGKLDALITLTTLGESPLSVSGEDLYRKPLEVALHSGQFEVTRYLRRMGIEMTLHEAAIMGDLDAFEDITGHAPASLEIQDGIKNTPLLSALTVGRLDSAEKLLYMGADWQTYNVEGNNALHIAIVRNYPKIISLLIEAGGATLDMPRSTYLRESPVQLAVQEAPLSMLRFLIEHGAPIDLKDTQGYTALHRALEKKDFVRFELLLEAGANVHTKNKAGHSLLHTAIVQRSLDMAALALEFGARPNVWDVQRQTAMHYAARIGAASVVDLLLSYDAVPDFADIEGRTPLMLAAAEGHIEILRRLAMGSWINVRDAAGRTAIHHAVEGGNEECLRFLLDAGADPDIADNTGAPPLFYALQDIKHALAHQLVAAGAKLDTRLPDGRTLLYAPLHEDTPDLTGWLLEQGLTPMERDSTGWTPLHQAARVGSEQVIKLLLDHGADVDAVDKNGITPMHVAAERGHILVIKGLAGGGAGDSPADNHGWLPIHFAAANGHWGPIQFFLLRGVDINSPLADGRTPLHLAAENGQVRTVTLLFGRGADLLATDKEGHSPLDSAAGKRVIASNETCRTPKESSDELSMQVTHNYLRLACAELLHDMVVKDDADGVRRLLKLHPEFANVMFQGLTPLQHAVMAGNMEAIGLLLEAGARPAARDETGLGRTALHWAVAQQRQDIALDLANAAPELLDLKDANGQLAAEMPEAAGWPLRR